MSGGDHFFLGWDNDEEHIPHHPSADQSSHMDISPPAIENLIEAEGHEPQKGEQDGPEDQRFLA